MNAPAKLIVLALIPGLMPVAPARRGSIDIAGALASERVKYWTPSDA